MGQSLDQMELSVIMASNLWKCFVRIDKWVFTDYPDC